MAWLAALFQLMRAPRAAVISSLVFVVLLVRTGDSAIALTYSLPVMLTCVIGFLINNLHDVEKDRLNHPERPLPRGTISVQSAAAAFFALLAIVLVLIKAVIPQEIGFLYVLGILGLINYNYIVAYLWYLKNIYAAVITTIPVFGIWEISPPPLPLWGVAASVLLHSLGTEMLSDIKDQRGDGLTPVKWIGLDLGTSIAFVCRLSAVGLLFVFVNTTLSDLAIGAMLFSELAIMWMWYVNYDPRIISIAAQVQLAIGMCIIIL